MDEPKKYRSLAIILLLLTGLGGSSLAVFQGSDTADLLRTADELFAQVGKLRGLQLKGPVQKGIKNREEIRQFLDARVREEYDESELLREGLVLRKLGLIPPGMDYKDFTLKLLTEQVGGFYDPEKKTLFIAGWLPVEQQRPVLVHELTHALQDQHFDLSRFIKRNRDSNNDDRAMAQHAVFEGEGIAVMLDYMLEPSGKNFADLPNLMQVLRSQLSEADSQFEVFRQAPMFMRESLIFPYGYGAAFLQRVRSRDSWAAVDRIYEDLPASTEQILHPEKYFEERDAPQEVEIEDPAPRLGKQWRSTYRNVLGEFSLYLILKSQISDKNAMDGAAGWDGDSILLVEGEEGRGAVVILESVWDTTADADEFYYALELWLARRFPDARKIEESMAALEWSQGGERHVIRRKEDRVRMILGWPEEHRAKLKGF